MFISGVVVGAIIGAVVLSCIALLSHTHKWEARALTYMTISTTVGEDTFKKADVTEVLYVCSCGEVKTKQLVGSWKMEDIQVTSNQNKDDEVKRLRKMAGMEDSQ